MKRMMKGMTLLATMTAVPLVFMTSAFAAVSAHAISREVGSLLSLWVTVDFGDDCHVRYDSGTTVIDRSA